MDTLATNLLNFIARYRFTTEAHAFQLVAQPLGLTKSAVRKTLYLLKKKKLIRAARYGEFRYFILLPKAAQARKLSRRRGFTMNQRTLFEATTRIYAEQIKHVVRLLTPKEFRGTYPQLVALGFSNDNYCELDDGALALLQTDVEQPEKSVWRKVSNAIRRRYDLAGWDKVIQDGRFTVIVATAFNSKRRTLKRLIRKRNKSYARVRVVVVPALQSLIFSMKGKPRGRRSL